jgi:hypothetical protein
MAKGTEDRLRVPSVEIRKNQLRHENLPAFLIGVRIADLGLAHFLATGGMKILVLGASRTT